MQEGCCRTSDSGRGKTRTPLLPRFQRDGRHDGLALLDLHPLARLLGVERRKPLERLAGVDGDLDVRAVADVLLGPAARNDGHLALVDSDRTGLRIERAASFVLEGPFVGAQVPVPAALLAI